MKEISKEAASVIEWARRAPTPSNADSDRVRKLLDARLAGEIALVSTSAKTIVSIATVKKIALALVVMSLSAVGIWKLRVSASQSTQSIETHVREAPTATRESHVEPIAVTPPVLIAPVVPIAPMAVTSVASSAPTRPTTTQTTRSSSEPRRSSARSIADEMVILRGAESDLRAGNSAAALTALDHHAALFPNGMLREERLAARILALCGLGRVSEARAEAAVFLAHSPHSVHADRVRRSCARINP